MPRCSVSYAPLAITGVHQTTLAIDMQMIQSMGATLLWPLIALSNIAQAWAVLGISIFSRKTNERDISVPAAIFDHLGVIEPAMYGINLKYRFPMLCAMVGSACAAMICSPDGMTANSIGVGGLPGILSIKPQFWLIYLLAILVSAVIPLLLTIMVYKYKATYSELPV